MNVREFLVRLRNAMRIARAYMRWPYFAYWTREFDEYNHEHDCLLVRFPNIDFAAVCPHANCYRRFTPGRLEECDFCRYFARIDYARDAETGTPELRLFLDERFLARDCIDELCGREKQQSGDEE